MQRRTYLPSPVFNDRVSVEKSTRSLSRYFSKIINAVDKAKRLKQLVGLIYVYA
jgi:hypothetical protein